LPVESLSSLDLSGAAHQHEKLFVDPQEPLRTTTMPAKRGASLWAETTPITKDMAREARSKDTSRLLYHFSGDVRLSVLLTAALMALTQTKQKKTNYCFFSWRTNGRNVGEEVDIAGGVGYNPSCDGRDDTICCGSGPPRDNSSGADARSTIKGIKNVNAISAAPGSSTAGSSAATTTTVAAAAAATIATTTESSAAGASSLYSISTHSSPADEGKDSAPNDATITKYLNSVKERASPSSFYSNQKFGGILASSKRDYKSSSGSGSSGSSSSSIVVGARKHSAVSFQTGPEGPELEG